MPEGTLKATAEHGTTPDVLRQDGGGSDQTLGEFEKAGVGIAALAEKLQTEGAESFVQSWRELLQAIDAKSTKLRQHARA
jgi:transaldolase